MPLLNNDGTGRYVFDVSRAFPRIRSAPFDADGDGDLDILELTHDWIRERIVWNDGTGHLIAARQRLPTFSGLAMPVDLDADGDLDLLFAPSSGSATLWENLGGMRFRIANKAAISVRKSWSDGEAWPADVDTDGDLDLVVRDPGSSWPSLLRNLGTGRFAPDFGALPRQGNGGRTAIGDIDGDGDTDVLVGGYPPLGSGWVMRNDGTGGFTPDRPVPGVRRFTALVDIDADGDSDVLIHGMGIANDPVWTRVVLNDGHGGFAVAPIHPADEAIVARGLGDLDGDGDTDRDRRQGGVPEPPPTARYAVHPTAWLLVSCSSRVDRWSAAGVLWAAPRLRARPLCVPGLGTWHLDDVTAFPVLGFLVVPPMPTVLPIVIPASPAFAGSTLHFQALLVPLSSAPVALTNATTDAVLR